MPSLQPQIEAMAIQQPQASEPLPRAPTQAYNPPGFEHKRRNRHQQAAQQAPQEPVQTQAAIAQPAPAQQGPAPQMQQHQGFAPIVANLQLPALQQGGHVVLFTHAMPGVPQSEKQKERSAIKSATRRAAAHAQEKAMAAQQRTIPAYPGANQQAYAPGMACMPQHVAQHVGSHPFAIRINGHIPQQPHGVQPDMMPQQATRPAQPAPVPHAKQQSRVLQPVMAPQQATGPAQPAPAACAHQSSNAQPMQHAPQMAAAGAEVAAMQVHGSAAQADSPPAASPSRVLTEADFSFPNRSSLVLSSLSQDVAAGQQESTDAPVPPPEPRRSFALAMAGVPDAAPLPRIYKPRAPRYVDGSSRAPRSVPQAKESPVNTGMTSNLRADAPAWVPGMGATQMPAVERTEGQATVGMGATETAAVQQPEQAAAADTAAVGQAATEQPEQAAIEQPKHIAVDTVSAETAAAEMAAAETVPGVMCAAEQAGAETATAEQLEQAAAETAAAEMAAADTVATETAAVRMCAAETAAAEQAIEAHASDEQKQGDSEAQASHNSGVTAQHGVYSKEKGADTAEWEMMFASSPASPRIPAVVLGTVETGSPVVVVSRRGTREDAPVASKPAVTTKVSSALHTSMQYSK